MSQIAQAQVQLPAEDSKGETPLKSIAAERRYRSLLKAVSWRVTGTLDTILISFIVTGRVKLAVSIGFVELFTKIGLFYAHERLWHKIPWGRTRSGDEYTI